MLKLKQASIPLVLLMTLLAGCNWMDDKEIDNEGPIRQMENDVEHVKDELKQDVDETLNIDPKDDPNNLDESNRNVVPDEDVNNPQGNINMEEEHNNHQINEGTPKE